MLQPSCHYFQTALLLFSSARTLRISLTKVYPIRMYIDLFLGMDIVITSCIPRIEAIREPGSGALVNQSSR